jgi:hypothetical protein
MQTGDPDAGKGGGVLFWSVLVLSIALLAFALFLSLRG